MAAPHTDWVHPLSPVPAARRHDLTSTRFLGKMFLVVPLLAALAAHLAEPGVLTTDKAKKNQ